MTNRKARALTPALLLGLILAADVYAQPVQKEVPGISFTGEVMALDTKANTVTVRGANGEKGVFHVDAKKTTIMSGSQEAGIDSLSKGDWIAIDADSVKDRKVATYIEVVEDVGSGTPARARATAAGATIEVRHNKLSPATVQIAAGQSVTFNNLDSMPGGHTVVTPDGSLSSPALAKGESWSHSFDVPGVYTVRIKEHPAAEASIVVE